MLLCSLSKEEQLSSGEIAERFGINNSNASKVVLSVEKKGYISRDLGKVDKRQMDFSLTKEEKQRLVEIKCSTIELPAELKQIIGNE